MATKFTLLKAILGNGTIGKLTFSYWTVDRFQLHVENAEISYKWIMPTQTHAYRLILTRANIVKYRGVYKTEVLCEIVYKGTSNQ